MPGPIQMRNLTVQDKKYIKMIKNLLMIQQCNIGHLPKLIYLNFNNLYDIKIYEGAIFSIKAAGCIKAIKASGFNPVN